MTIEYVSVTEAAKTAGISRKTVLRRIRDGMLSAEKLGIGWCIARTELKRFLADQRGDTATEKKANRVVYEQYQNYMRTVYGPGPWLPTDVLPRDRWREWSGVA